MSTRPGLPDSSAGDLDGCGARAPLPRMLVTAGLSVRRGATVVLHEIALQIPADACISVIGPNGSGKSTLLLALLGVLTPVAGRVLLDGVDLARVPPRQRARFAAYVPQSVEQLPALRLRDIVAGGRFPFTGTFGRFTSADATAIESALERCGLAALAERPFDAVSGGERQKTLIAAAMAQDAQMLVLDEPNAALDPAYQLELVQLLRDWHARGRGVLLVSHDLQLPAALGGRVIALRGGRVAGDGAAAQVLTPAHLGMIYNARFGVMTTAAGNAVVMPEWWTL